MVSLYVPISGKNSLVPAAMQGVVDALPLGPSGTRACIELRRDHAMFVHLPLDFSPDVVSALEAVGDELAVIDCIFCEAGQ